MARFDTSGLDDLINDMRRMEQDSGPAAEGLVMAAAEIIRQAWERSAQEHGLIRTGGLIKSIGYPKKPTDFGSALGIDVYPQGKNKRGTRYAEIAFILHYGTSRIKPTYWVDDADKYCEETVPVALQKLWDEYLATGKIPSASAIAAALPAGGGAKKETIR